MDHKDSTPNKGLGWAATAAGGLGLLLALALMAQPRLLIGTFDIAIPTILGVAAIVLALRVGKPHRWIGLATGALTVLVTIFAVAVLLFDDPFDDADLFEQGSSSKPSDEKKEDASKQGALVDFGFGQDEYSVGLAAIVKNKSDDTGQSVTVSFNLKDADGKVVKTTSETGSFSWPGQELALIGSASVDEGVVVESVDATLLVEAGNSDRKSSDLGTSDAPLVKGEYGGSNAKVSLTNPTTKVLKNPYIAVVCRDDAGEIAGSGFTFPDLIGPKGEFADDVSVTVSESAKSCKAYVTLSNLS